MRKYIIYKITNTINSKIYIGRTSIGIKSRWRDHLTRFKEGSYSHLRLYRAFLKYGIENFIIEEIDSCQSFEDMKRIEGEWILKTQSFKKEIGYNMSIDTSNGIEFLDEDILEKRKISIYRSYCEKARAAGKFIGVAKAYAKSPSWRAGISINKKRLCFTLPTSKEAAEFYDKLSLFVYGDNAILNFPEKKPLYLKEDITSLILEKQKRDIEKRARPTYGQNKGICFHRKHNRWSFCVVDKQSKKRLTVTKFDTEEDALFSRNEFLENNPEFVISLFD